MAEKIGNNDIELAQEEQKHLQDLRQRAKQRSKNRMLALKQVIELRQANHDAHTKLIRQTLAKANVNFDDLQTEIERRHAIQRKKLQTLPTKTREKYLSQIKKEMRDRRKIEIAYRKKFKDDLLALEGNPVLKFYMAVDMDTRLIATPSGLYGGRNPPEWSYSDAMRVDFNDPERTGELNWHAFYPELYIDNGSFRDQHTLELEQSITLYRRPLESGRGNFLVDFIKINLNGAGYFEATDLDSCPFFLDSRGKAGAGQVHLDLDIFQRVPAPLSCRVIDNYDLWNGAFGHSEAFSIDLRALRFSRSFLLAGPDGGGEGIMLTITLRTHIRSADERHAVSRLEMNRDTFGGLELGCIELHGEYIGA